jgi:glycosyltransferase involved in cell wall biosynthesis
VRILALSEHFRPRFGGTVTYVHKTCEALAAQGHAVELLVPGPKPDSVPEDMLAGLPYAVRWVDAGYPPEGEPPRAARYAFCRLAAREVETRAADPARRPDVVHVMFGLFLMEVLDTRRLAPHGIATVATVHNVPPMECARTWEGSPARERLIERVRLRGVAVKNAARLRRHPYDLYVVPSRPVAALLRGVLGEPRIEVIGHGVDEELLAQMDPPPSRQPAPDAPVRVFTAGGWAPHKRQAVIPDAIAQLAGKGIDVRWEIAGPSTRIAGYRDAVEAQARALGVADSLLIDGAVERRALAAGYDRANLYVQPSTEEGFCLTALDAAAAGLAVIGCEAGAIPEICAFSGGKTVPSTGRDLAEAIEGFVAAGAWDAGQGSDWVRREMSWSRAAERLADAMQRLGAGRTRRALGQA